MTGKQLKEARKLLKFSQKQLGAALGFTTRIQIGKYERGDVNIPKTTELSIRYLLIKADLPDATEDAVLEKSVEEGE